MLKDNADKISAGNKVKLETAANAVKDALKGDEIAAIKTASETLNQTWQAISTELYKAAAEKTRAGKGPAGGQPGTPPEADDHHDGHQQNEEPVIDAEVVEEGQPA
jgi:molecular chaperone DnaK